jgi:TPR repeat protein
MKRLLAIVFFCGFLIPCANAESQLFRVLQTQVDLDPQLPGAVIVKVHLLNRTTTPHSYPAIQLTLTDRAGETIGKRTYTEGDYRTVADTDRVEPNTVAVITLHLAGPDGKTVGFHAMVVPPDELNLVEALNPSMALVHERRVEDTGKDVFECARIGPFSTTDTYSRASRLLINEGFGFTRNVVSARELRAFRVYLGPFTTQAAKETAKRRLKQQGLDYYVYEDKDGELLSVARLFSDGDAAGAYVAELKGVGLDAKARSEVRTLGPWRWLEVADAETEERRNMLHGFEWGDAKVQVAGVPCISSEVSLGDKSAWQAGELFRKGDGVEKNYAEAVKWYQQAANEGDLRAEFWLGSIYMGGGYGITQDRKEGFYWFMRCAEKGDDICQVSVGTAYEYGSGVRRDIQQALNWLRRSAEQGNRGGQFGLARFYERGLGVPRDIDKAIELNQLAAAQGHKDAKTALTRLQGIQNAAALSVKTDIELEFWKSCNESDGPDECLAYLEKYPEGEFVSLVMIKLKKVGSTTISVASVNDDVNYGGYHALVIGNNDHDYLSDLETAINDAESIAALLEDHYNFQVNLLRNATRGNIVKALAGLRRTVGSQDNLLIYYAGHGYLDKDVNEGYWLPIDADPDDPSNWLQSDTVAAQIRGMDAKHVLVVADSCFSGALMRGFEISQQKGADYLHKLIKKKARTALTSGGLEPVMDAGGSGHSVFAQAFISVLEENTGILDTSQLFSQLRPKVMSNSDQTPEYGYIHKTGHDGGDFVFVKNDHQFGKVIKPEIEDKVKADAGQTEESKEKDMIGDGRQAWIVQVGIFQNSENVTQLIANLRKDGRDAKAETIEMDGRQATRIWLGPFSTRSEATREGNKAMMRTHNKPIVKGWP